MTVTIRYNGGEQTFTLTAPFAHLTTQDEVAQACAAGIADRLAAGDPLADVADGWSLVSQMRWLGMIGDGQMRPYIGGRQRQRQAGHT